MKKALKLNTLDNVAVCTENISAGDEVICDEQIIIAQNDIAFPHKISLQSIAKGSKVIKYGNVIAYATEDIKPGEWVHTHNISSTPQEANQ